MNNIYYCPNNIIIDNFEVIKKYEEKEKYVVMDYFILDLVEKKIKLYEKEIQDSFIDDLKNISSISITKQKERSIKVITLTPTEGSPIIIEIDELNRIISYQNDNIVQIGNKFLYKNKVLKNLSLPGLEYIGH